MRLFSALAAILAFTIPALAQIHSETVEYKQGNATLEGYLAYDESVQGKRPGVLVFHEWMGIQPYEKMRAEQLAKLGCVAFVADILIVGTFGKNAKGSTAADVCGRALRRVVPGPHHRAVKTTPCQ